MLDKCLSICYDYKVMKPSEFYAKQQALAQVEADKWYAVVTQHIQDRWARVAAANEAKDWDLANRLTKDTLAYEKMNGRQSCR